MFNSPDAFLNDWYGHLTNQPSHLMAGLVAFAVLACLLKLLFKWADWDDDHKVMALTVLAVGYATWETMQLMAGATLLDGFEDWFFVMSGGALGYLFWVGRRRLGALVLFAASGVLAIGTLKRYRRSKK